MTTLDLLAELKRSGVVLTVAGDRLRVEAPQGAITDELRELLTQHKPELMTALLPPPAWPQESLDAEHRFGHRAARLYPFLGRRVSTPGGPAKLLQVFSDRVCVVLDQDVRRASYFLPSEVLPPDSEPIISSLEERSH